MTGGSEKAAARTPAPAYDFFAPAGPGAAPSHAAGSPAAAAAPATNQFGTPTTNQFGTPTTNQFGTPVAGVPSPLPPPTAAATTRRGAAVPPWLIRAGIGLGIAVVLGAFGVGRFSGIGDWLQGDLEAPPTLGGMALSGTTDASAAFGLEPGFAGAGVDEGDVLLAGYRDGLGAAVVLVAARAEATEGQEEPDYVAATLQLADTRVVGAGACGVLEQALVCAVVRDDLLTAVAAPTEMGDVVVVDLALEAHRSLS